MGTIKAIFYDTYALIEAVFGNKNYMKYLDATIITTQMNMVELYYTLFSEYDKEKAEAVYFDFRDGVVDIDDETIFEAIALRKKYNKRRLSYTDCIGYTYAKRHNIKFLTGDKEFEDLPNVEFVK